MFGRLFSAARTNFSLFVATSVTFSICPRNPDDKFPVNIVAHNDKIKDFLEVKGGKCTSISGILEGLGYQLKFPEGIPPKTDLNVTSYKGGSDVDFNVYTPYGIDGAVTIPVSLIRNDNHAFPQSQYKIAIKKDGESFLKQEQVGSLYVVTDTPAEDQTWYELNVGRYPEGMPNEIQLTGEDCAADSPPFP